MARGAEPEFRQQAHGRLFAGLMTGTALCLGAMAASLPAAPAEAQAASG